ncbi:MAG: hypothetical protein A2261_00725 [Candidatus Magasanikbacteria bacterium RIFOXYA2_FULL_44_8]|uniref:Uncharacterized protein n=1 Tax=Candidatus Magasanikbacteria bacterium RIFOXYA2_FULL_44_8 TaxID=1798696 RepID=A0A1F6NL53_9BACT|nr:MAG: hypothetical protein A2261_00725 [Candidatus Magasanikbacteria bacterium RIFOXYA2_FULL_44_8]
MQTNLKYWKILIVENWWYAIGAALCLVLLLSVIYALIFERHRTFPRYEQNDTTAGVVGSGAVQPAHEITDEEWTTIENEEDGG